MEKLEQLHLPVYYESDGIDVKTQHIICMCCIAKSTKFYKLTNCEHATTFLTNLVPELQMDKSAAICFLCHGLIKKLHNFKLQVEKSLLNVDRNCHEYFSYQGNKQEVTHFTFSNIETNSTIDSEPVKYESTPFPMPNEVKTESPIQDFSPVKLEIKIEYDSTDAEKEPAAPKKNKTSKKPKNTLENKYEGKIRVVTLTVDEMMEERRCDALKPGFLKLPFKCEKCITGFDHEPLLKDHIEQRHTMKKGGITCDTCKSVLSSKSSLYEHNKRHFRRFECVECYKRYNNIQSVLKHYNELHGKIGIHFACKLCDYTTESNRSYRYHMDKHRSAKVQCADCGSTFVNKTGLRVHILTIHGSSQRVYTCAQCGRSYNCKSGLAAHVSAHAGAAYCAPCDVHFRSKLGLRKHLRTHSAHVRAVDKKFACGECDSKFLSKSALQEHVDWEHRHRTKHACDLCSKVFKNRLNLKKHREFVHEKKRPPRNKICDHCGRGFTTTAILQAHIRTHTGERPLRCTRCPASFAHSAALYTHNKLLHAT
ncbi:zinc finger protein OZF-like [Aricia agestis]|uniref:zinc finger protein OZF-like n=1 Tax=Aricia agestis TaxID=91739 RepID=UPI001C20B82C|nr:zinc finger protein OZF-like [Aricia agestis]